jgi:hypothetical protein
MHGDRTMRLTGTCMPNTMDAGAHHGRRRTRPMHAGAFARVVGAELDSARVALKVQAPQWCNPDDERCCAMQQHFVREAQFLTNHQHP